MLGAQAIASDRPLDGAMGVSSGGFGPMVQPGQAVVNYRIAPDADERSMVSVDARVFQGIRTLLPQPLQRG